MAEVVEGRKGDMDHPKGESRTVIDMKKTEHFGWKDIYGLMGVNMDFSGADVGAGEWDYLDEVEFAELPAPARTKLDRGIHSQEIPVEVEG